MLRCIIHAHYKPQGPCKEKIYPFLIKSLPGIHVGINRAKYIVNILYYTCVNPTPSHTLQDFDLGLSLLPRSYRYIWTINLYIPTSRMLEIYPF